MERIGTGSIGIARIFTPEQQKELNASDDSTKKYLFAMPYSTELEINGSFSIDPAIWNEFKISTFELMTNFATADFSGRSIMGFESIMEHEGQVISFKFKAPFYPTEWSPEAIVKLHFFEISTGKQYTSFFKCKLGKLTRNVFVGNTGEMTTCYFDIINPNSYSYHSSSQASLESTPEAGAIPKSSMYQKPTGVQVPFQDRSTQTKTCPICQTRNPVENSLCSNCGHTFSIQPIQQAVQPPIPQPANISSPDLQIPQFQYDKTQRQAGKSGKSGKSGRTLIIIIIVAVALTLLCLIFGGPSLFFR